MADRKKPTKPSQGKPRPDAGSTRRDQGWPRWGIWLMMGLIGAALFFPSFLPTDEAKVVSYDQFLNLVVADEVTDVQVDNETGASPSLLLAVSTSIQRVLSSCLTPTGLYWPKAVPPWSSTPPNPTSCKPGCHYCYRWV